MIDSDFRVRESVLNRKGFYSETSFLPNSTFFNQTDQDITLLFLSNTALYTDEVEDAWFGATQPNPWFNYGFGQVYTTDYFGAAVMACMEQYALCNPNLSGSGTECTALSGRYALIDRMIQSNGTFLQMNAPQWGAAIRLLSSIYESSIGQVLFSLGASSLQAQSYANWGTGGFTSAPVPDNQWQLEVWNWHNITMANIQQWAIEYVTGPRNRAYDKYIVQPDAIVSNDLCSNQRQRSDDAMSFNVLGIIIILVVGCVIIITNMSLPTIVGFIQKRFDVGAYRRTEWALDEVLQLQRMAYQRSGNGTWRKTESIVPLSAHDEKFQHLRHAEGVLYSPPSRGSVITEYHYVALKS